MRTNPDDPDQPHLTEAISEHFRELIDAMPCAVYVCDRAAVIQTYNSLAGKLWGREPKCGDPGEHFCGSLRLYFPNGERLPHSETPIMKVMETGIPVRNVEAFIERPDGARTAVLASFSPLYNVRREIVGGITTVDDITKYQHAVNALRISQENYRTLVEASPNAIFIDGKDRILYVNPAMMHMLGATSSEQLLGKSPLEIVHPDCQAVVEDRNRRLRENPQPVPPREEKYRRLDGTAVDVEVGATPITYENEPAILVMAHDVSERKRSMALLAGSAEILGQIAEGVSSSDILLTLTRLAEQVCAGMQASVLLVVDGKLRHGAAPSLPAEYIRFMDGLPIGPAAGSCGTAAYLGQAVVVTDIATDPLWVKWRDFALRFGLRACWSTPLMANGRIFGTFALYYHEPRGPSAEEQAVVERLTRLARIAIERAEAAAALQRSEGLLRISQRIGHVGSWDWDLGSQQLTWSDEMYRIFGVDPETFERTIEAAVALTHPDDQARVQQSVVDFLAGAPPSSLEYRIRRPDQEIRTIWATGDLLRDSTGNPSRVVGTVMDITERKREEDERRRLEMQLVQAQKLESLAILAGGVAHDFNNLLTAVMSYTDLALMQLPDQSNARPMLREVDLAARRAAELTQQMLAYSGRGNFVIQVFRLDAVVHELATLLGTVVSKKATLQLELGSATVEGDATQIRQVVMNLITNASDALEQRAGTICVRTAVRHVDSAYLQTCLLADDLAAGVFAVIEVADPGCGMSPDVSARMFDPLFTTKFTGRGLGLAAVLGIVKGHRGAIRVDSAPGRGTKICVLLPCCDKSPDDGHAGRGANSPPCRRGTVLVVDDETSLRRLLRGILETAGFSVLEAGDGLEGLDLFRAQCHEIVGVLLDLTMPRMDGVDVLREIRLLKPDIPVLAMSGYTNQEVSRQFAGMAAIGFIQKPFVPRDLMARFGALLSHGDVQAAPDTI